MRFPDKGLNCSLQSTTNFLDPRFRGTHLLESGRLEGTECELEEDWKIYDNNDNNKEETLPVRVEPKASKEPMSPNSKLRQTLKSRTELNRQSYISKICNEIERYEMFSIHPKICSILAWWKWHKDGLLILAYMARRCWLLLLPLPCLRGFS